MLIYILSTIAVLIALLFIAYKLYTSNVIDRILSRIEDRIDTSTNEMIRAADDIKRERERLEREASKRE